MNTLQNVYNGHMHYLHTMVRVKNLAESLDFYVSKLGLQKVSRKENETGRFTLVFLKAPGDLPARLRATRGQAPRRSRQAGATSATWPTPSITSTSTAESYKSEESS